MIKLIKWQANMQIAVLITNIATSFLTRNSEFDVNVEKTVYIIVGFFTTLQILFTLLLRYKIDKAKEYTVKDNAPILSYLYVIINFMFVATIYARWKFI